ncbi:MAG: alpha/beta hydrolase [Halanaeroarchaeum sp.]
MRADEPHPQVRAVLERMDRLGVPDFVDADVERARERFESMGSVATYRADLAVDDRTVDGPAGDLSVRVYEPARPRATLVFFHGGGFVVGSVESHDALARALADRVDVTVVSVDYRLAPEHPFPAAVRDAVTALEWTDDEADGLGGRPLVVAGDSAGGTLAAVVSLLGRDGDAPSVAHQVLFYPATSQSEDWTSVADDATGRFLSAAEMAWFGEQYLRDPLEGANPYAFPLNACDLSGLPPASVLTAGFDPLRDEGVAYADRLAAADVPVTHRNYPAMVHGFVSMLGVVDAAETAIDDVADDLASPLS